MTLRTLLATTFLGALGMPLPAGETETPPVPADLSWFGPEISFSSTENTTAADVLEAVKREIYEKEPGGRVPIQLLVSGVTMDKVPVKGLELRKMPALLVLQYLADLTGNELICDPHGVWIFRLPPARQQIAVEKVEPKELAALGLKAGEKGEVAVVSGPAWPGKGHDHAVLDGSNLVFSGTESEVVSLKTLLALHRTGMRIPKINARVSPASVDADRREALKFLSTWRRVRPPFTGFFWTGPALPSLSTDVSPTALDAVKLIRTALAAAGGSRTAIRIVPDDKDLAERSSGTLALKNVPAAIALGYVAEGAHCEFVCEDGLWIFRPYSPGVEFFSAMIGNVTSRELGALGLRLGPGDLVSVVSGSPWPLRQQDKAGLKMYQDTLIAKGDEVEIRKLRLLFILMREGYAVPAINSAAKATDGN